MEEINGVTIYWLLTIGAAIGYFIEMIMGRRGMSLFGNIICGIIGSLSIGLSAIFLNLPGALLFSAIGSIAFLFLVNIFSTHPHHASSVNVVETSEEP